LETVLTLKDRVVSEQVCESVIKVKESIRAKCVAYLERAEKLKEYIKAGSNGDSKKDSKGLIRVSLFPP
jgi:hypothetical protein